MSQQASSSNLQKMEALKENSSSKDYSILVTGATGFIGKKLLERLATTGYKVTAMSRTKHQIHRMLNLLPQMLSIWSHCLTH